MNISTIQHDMPAANDYNPEMLKCRVHVKTWGGEQEYEGIFASTTEAALDAEQRVYPMECKVKVEVMP